MSFEDFKRMHKPLEEFATIHQSLGTAVELFEKLKSFDEAKWAFRGQGKDWPLNATIDRYAIRPGVAEDYAMREFRRRAHQYSISVVPRRDDDLEWLALMQHHGAPTRLLDWTRSPQVAAFFAAQSSNSANPFVREPSDPPPPPFVIWAVDTDSINAEATRMLGLSEDADLSSPDTFHEIFWGPAREEVYLVVAVQPHRINERLTIQQGLFLCANRALIPFHNCLASLLNHATNLQRPSAQWLHKIVVASKARADVLRTLDKMNINSTTLFPSLDGFCQSLQITIQIQELDGWPGVAVTKDRENWVKGK